MPYPVEDKVSTHRVTVRIFEGYRRAVSARRVREMARRALAAASPAPATLTVVIADDDTVRELNLRHRGLDETTDVLSFSFSHQGPYYGDGPPPSQWSQGVDFILAPGVQEGLGEVVISLPQVARQAQAHKEPLLQELAFLLAHGVLHLLGRDHKEPEEQAAMEAEEARLMGLMLKE